MTFFAETRRVLAALTGAAMLVHSAGAGAAVSFMYRVPVSTGGAAVYNPAQGGIADLTATPSTVVAGAGTLVSVTAVVKDKANQTATDGQSVDWSADGGHFANASGATSSGVATGVYTPPDAVGTYSVTATLSSSGAARSATVQVVANEHAAVVTSLNSDDASIPVGGRSTTITALVRDAYGNALGAGVPVYWTADQGTLSSATTTTGANGEARVSITSPSLVGMATVGARAGASDGGLQTTVSFTSDAASAGVAMVSGTTTFMPANGSAQANFSATLRDANGNLAPAGVTVRWTTTAGTLSSASTLTDANGTAGVTLTAGTTTTVATVYAYGVAGDPGKSKNISFDADFTTARVVELTSSAASIIGDNVAAAVLTATMSDANGNALGSGATVTWSTDRGALSSTSSTTNASGQATVSLRSGSAGGGVTAAVTARGAAGDSGRAVAVGFTAPPPVRFVVGMYLDGQTTYATLQDGNTVVAQVKDAAGKNVQGATVYWSTNFGVLNTPTSVTNSLGYAMVLASSGAVGTATVNAKLAPGDAGMNSPPIHFVPN